MKPQAAAQNRTVLYSTMGHNRRDYEAFYANSNAIHFTEIHNHDFFEIYIHLHGGRTLWINDQVYTLESGSLIIFPPFQMHGITHKEALFDYERAFLYITPDTLRALGCGVMPFEELLTEKTLKGTYKFNLSPDACARCVQLLRQIAARVEDQRPDTTLLDYACMMEFLVLVCQTIGDARNAGEPQTVNEIMQKVIRYINENFTHTLTLDGLAAHFSISKSYLSHEFQRFTHRSVYNYILYRRVTLAKELIFTGARLTDVSFQCGFSDYSSFLRAFKKMTGTAPRTFSRRVNQP